MMSPFGLQYVKQKKLNWPLFLLSKTQDLKNDMPAEYRPLDDDGTDGSHTSSSIRKPNATSHIPTDLHSTHSNDDTIDLLPSHRNQSFETQTLITTLNLREEYEQQHGTATSFSCVINLANTILGTGMLAMVPLFPTFIMYISRLT